MKKIQGDKMNISSNNSIINNSIEDNIIQIARILSEKPKLRKRVLIISSILVFISIMTIIVNINFNFFNHNNFLNGVSIVVGIPSFILLISGIFSFITPLTKTTNEQIAELEEERKIIEKKIEKNSNSIIDIILLNLKQLNEYYKINKIQARKSYNFSVFTIICGLLLITFGVSYSIYQNDISNLSIITGMAGVLAEFIGGTSLYLFKESTKQIEMFFNKLSYIQNVMLAIDLTEKLDNSDKSKQIGLIIESLLIINK